MKFTYTDKAKEFIDENNIKELYIKLLMPKGSCCGVNTLRVDIKTEDSKNKQYYKVDYDNVVTTYFDPQFDMVLHDRYDEIVISVFGIGNMKKFISETEINPVSMS